MKFLVVGLGNPGKEYEQTRHNAGRMVLDALQNAHGFSAWESHKAFSALVSSGVVEGKPVTLFFPETYMNNSGKAVKKALRETAEEVSVIVVYDDIDLPLGTLKISHGRGSGGHHGVDSVIAELGTKAFTRLRIGIAPQFEGVVRKPKGEDAVLSFLMKPFTPSEREIIEEVAKRADVAVAMVVAHGPQYAMNAVNQHTGAAQ